MLPNTSVAMIAWNEEEMLPYALAFLDSLEMIAEIVILDHNSTDRTVDIVCRFSRQTKKQVRLLIDAGELTSFADRKNKVLDSVSEDISFTLLMDCDETYSQNLDMLLGRLAQGSSVTACRFPTMTLFPDRRHYIAFPNPDPHVRLWRTGMVHYEGDIHEAPVDVHGRRLHDLMDGDIMDERTHVMDPVVLKHAQLLKSDEALRDKGNRWARFFKASAEMRLPISETWWLDAKKSFATQPNLIKELPEHLFDATTRLEEIPWL